MKKRYWLRGGIIIVLGAVVYDIYYYQIVGTLFADARSDFFSRIILFPVAISMEFSRKTAYYHGSLEAAMISGGIIMFVVAIVIYFLLGALLGWLYGKMKNRKPQVPSTQL